MPTDPAVFAAVAHKLGGADPTDDDAVARFYRRLAGRAYTAVQRDIVFSFLLQSEPMPDCSDLERLAIMVTKTKRNAPDRVRISSSRPAIKHRRPAAAAE